MKHKCPICQSEVKVVLDNFRSDKISVSTGKAIVVQDVKTVSCVNKECAHSWLPLDEEERIDLTVARESRYIIQPKEIACIRDSFSFKTKAQAANFLCLNSKAFIKWENGHSEPNFAYDLLLRLVAFSRKNFEFVEYLHQKQFKFDEGDYELVADKKSIFSGFGRDTKYSNPLKNIGSSNFVGDNNAQEAA